jgi:DnaK suppressor protein
MATKKKTATTAAKKKTEKAAPAPKLAIAPIKKRLLEMRADLSRSVSRKDEIDTNDNGDSVDQAQLSIEKELLFELSDNERVTLDQIEAALRKIEKGTYGLCESCQKPIAKARIDALPFARYCITCQNNSESAPELVETGPDFRGIEEGGARGENA